MLKPCQTKLKRISVFCGSGSGFDEFFKSQALLLGEALAKQKIELVYGGAKVGLMGAIADATLNKGGRVIGIIPKFLKSKGIAHEHLSQLIWVDTMHERKLKMYNMSDGFIALPGGYGTVEELFEMLTWAQLGFHQKPIALLNINGFYDNLIALTNVMVSNGFLKEKHREMLLVDNKHNMLIERMKAYIAPLVEKWIG